jgi:hypothetical protein
MPTWCKRRPHRIRSVQRGEQAPAPRLEGRWQVVVHAWVAALDEALKLTQGNVEAAVAIAATMIFMD